MHSETVELSYPGLKDGQEFKVPQGCQTLTITDPSWIPVPSFEEDPVEFAKLIVPVLTFFRRPKSRVFVLEGKK